MKYLALGIIVLSIISFSCSSNNSSAASAETEEVSIEYNIPEGYELDILYAPKERGMGSWVALAEGANETFYASDQFGDLYQFQRPKVGEVLDSTQIQPIPLEIGRAQGLLWVEDRLYVSVNGPWKDGDGNEVKAGSGVYQLQDSDQDGTLDKMDLILRLEGQGEHGPHSLILSPDKQQLYFIAGNHTKIPDDLLKKSRLPVNWDEDNLFPPYLDARGHANKIKAPGGWIARMNLSDQDWELYSAGFRNPYDFGFNSNGELFAFDADMEWDFGMPWYRPIRVCHVTSGSEFGWRTGSGKWPTYYPDNLPSVIDLGQGSPTAVVMGHHLNFPEKYQDGLFVFDWSFGTVYFVDLKEEGSTYIGTKEEFFSGTPLPLTDAIAGSDGALYFATGGRNLNSHFYRLRYTGDEAIAQESAPEQGTSNDLRDLRQKLEAFHQTEADADLDFIWENLSHSDRFVRYAARIALEHQNIKNWFGKYTSESDPIKVIQASIAGARMEQKSVKIKIYEKLIDIDWGSLSKAQKVDWLRALNLNLQRLGAPLPRQKSAFVAKLNPQYPAKDYALDRELSQILLFLNAENAVEKTMDLLLYHAEERTITHPSMLSAEVSNRSEQYGPKIMKVLENMPATEAIYYVTLLSHVEEGWRKSQRSRYFNWFYDGLNAEGGMSYKPFLENIRQKAVSLIPEEEKGYFETLSGVYQPGEVLAEVPQPIGPGKAYSIQELRSIVNKSTKDYNGDYAAGKLVYQSALCSTCHRVNGLGGNSGPDLTQLATRFSQHAMLNAIINPNEAISDQYAYTLFKMKNGENKAGKILQEDDKQITLQPSPYSSTYTIEIKADSVESRTISPVSPMPPNLLNRLNETEIADLLAFLSAGGDPEHKIYTGDLE
ncbi:MAG: c-type cytochrome [Bacteroidota bacterium]